MKNNIDWEAIEISPEERALNYAIDDEKCMEEVNAVNEKIFRLEQKIGRIYRKYQKKYLSQAKVEQEEAFRRIKHDMDDIKANDPNWKP